MVYYACKQTFMYVRATNGSSIYDMDSLNFARKLENTHLKKTTTTTTPHSYTQRNGSVKIESHIFM